MKPSTVILSPRPLKWAKLGWKTGTATELKISSSSRSQYSTTTSGFGQFHNSLTLWYLLITFVVSFFSLFHFLIFLREKKRNRVREPQTKRQNSRLNPHQLRKKQFNESIIHIIKLDIVKREGVNPLFFKSQ